MNAETFMDLMNTLPDEMLVSAYKKRLSLRTVEESASAPFSGSEQIVTEKRAEAPVNHPSSWLTAAALAACLLFAVGFGAILLHRDQEPMTMQSSRDDLEVVNTTSTTTQTMTTVQPESSTVEEVCKTDVMTKDDAFHMILNSIDYYNYANGIIDTNFLNGSKTTIEYNVDMVDTKGYQHVIMDDFDEETFVENDVVYTINNLQDPNESNYCRQTIAHKKKNDKGDYSNDDERIGVKYGIPSYSYRLNPTNLHYASTVSIFAQEMAFRFLSNKSLWDITSYNTIFLDRLCISIEGRTEPNDSVNQVIKTFSMIIDKNTGIILYYEGRDDKGDITNYSKTTCFSCEKSDIPSISICP